MDQFQLLVAKTSQGVSQRRSLPAILAEADAQTQKRFFTYFTDQIRNKNTREAYLRDVIHFFDWCETKGLSLKAIQSFHVSAFVEDSMLQVAKPTVKRRLAAIRMLFDWLVVGQIIPLNPAAAVRGPKHVVKKGKTPVLDEKSAKALLEAIDTSHVVGLRDRALIGTMVYTFGRIEAVLQMNVEDYYPNGRRWWVRLHEKGGKDHEMPAHHKLDEFMESYLAAAGISDQKKGPLFRSTRGRSRQLTDRRLHRSNAWQMVRRRAVDADYHGPIGNHTFRATGITNYMQNGGELKEAQKMAAHESARTTGLYDRSDDSITLDEIERITI